MPNRLNCAIFVVSAIFITPCALNAQTADNYVGYSNSGGTLAAWNVTEGTMQSSQFVHTYYSTISISGPNVYATSPRQSGSAGSGVHASVRADVSVNSSIPGLYTLSPTAQAICSEVGSFFYSTSPSENVMNGYSPIQHNYPRNPLPQTCRISSFFDRWRSGKAHHAEDVVYDNNGHSALPPLGTPVTAMENGTVTIAEGNYGPASPPYPGCQGSPGNYVKIRGSDGYYTIYFHMTPSVSTGQPVTAGQIIGHLDNSGCQTGPHLHVGRKDPSGNPVNFTIPCVNPLPTSNYEDFAVEDDDPTDW